MGISILFIASLGQCPDSDTLNLEIHEFIEASINQLSDFCEGTDSVQLTATNNWKLVWFAEHTYTK